MRRRQVERELAGQVRFDRRTFLLLPGEGERPVYDDVVIAHRIRAAQLAPELGFAIPVRGQRYPRSSLPAALVALRCRDAFPDLLDVFEDAVFRAVFVELEDVADPVVLKRCAARAGLREEFVDHALRAQDLRRLAFAEHEEARRLGITRIPALVVPGQPPIIGAVDTDVYRRALRRALADAAEHRPS